MSEEAVSESTEVVNSDGGSQNDEFAVPDPPVDDSRMRNSKGEPKRKRARRAPERFGSAKVDPKDVPSAFESLRDLLRSWSESSLKSWSEYLQWQRDASNDDIAKLLGKDKHEISKLLDLIMGTEWKDIVLTNGIGSGILVNKDDDIANEKPLDVWFRRRLPKWKTQFWYQLCTMLTPAELNNSDQVAAVMKELAEKADEEYAPIYEYLAIIMDDPMSTVHMVPRLSGFQAGIVLEILHSIAIAVKESAGLHALLRERALAVVNGDWKTLKMPIRDDASSSSSSAQDKRVFLHGLNPFAMPKDVTPKIQNQPPVLPINLPSTSPVPVPSSKRSMASMNQLKTGFTTMHVIHETPKTLVERKPIAQRTTPGDTRQQSPESNEPVELSNFMVEKYGRRRIIKKVANPTDQTEIKADMSEEVP